jgi:phosphatidylserine/phosphatidylglycerophosphate/cardiolipin synthase-like enzyme
MADLTSIPTSELAGLRRRLEGGGGKDPLDSRDVGIASVLAGCSRAAALGVLQAVLAEREKRPDPTELVWTGPAPTYSGHRDTGVVLASLFAEARERVLLAGYSFDHGKEILAPLHEAMKQHGVETDLFINIAVADEDQPKLKSEAGRRAVVVKHVEGFLENNWPGSPYPRIHYDERPINSRLYASLHAKCVVVDDRAALVTSANFTNRGQERNVEVGALIRDPAFAKALAAQWHNALGHKLFATYESGSSEGGGVGG